VCAPYLNRKQLKNTREGFLNDKETRRKQRDAPGARIRCVEVRECVCIRMGSDGRVCIDRVYDPWFLCGGVRIVHFSREADACLLPKPFIYIDLNHKTSQFCKK
jgi:hypothetical protein